MKNSVYLKEASIVFSCGIELYTFPISSQYLATYPIMRALIQEDIVQPSLNHWHFDKEIIHTKIISVY